VGIYLQDIPTGTVTGPVLAGSMPVVSHDGSLMASEVKIATGAALFHFINIYEIPALRFVYRIGFTYGPNNPSVSNVGGIAFSADDARLLFSAIPPNETKREIYSIKLDGSDMKRLMTNVWDDFYPEGYK
jgi:hypothetical protein